MKLLKKDIVVYLSDGKELATPNVFRAVNSIQEDLISENEKAVANWVFRNNKHAGATTDTLSSAKCLYLAIRVNQHVYAHTQDKPRLELAEKIEANFYTQDLTQATPQQPPESKQPEATKITGKAILEAIRLMDAEERRELTRALFA